MKITPKIQKAIYSAAKLHANQKRKGNGLPFIVHPFIVAAIISNYTENEDVIVAGFLHDVLEDVPEYSEEDMSRDFGKRVLGFVKEVSEDKTPADGAKKAKITWRYRKERYLENLKTATKEAMMISAADKIHNLSSLTEDYKVLGEDLWKVFRAPESKKLWFYGEVVRIIKENLDSPIVNELEKTYLETKKIIGI